MVLGTFKGDTDTNHHEYLHKPTQNDQKILTQTDTKYLHKPTLFIFCFLLTTVLNDRFQFHIKTLLSKRYINSIKREYSYKEI